MRKNTSGTRIAASVVSNFIGLAIVMGVIAFYTDSRSIWESDSSFVKSDWLVLNHKVTSANAFEGASAFTEEEMADLRRQPWVRGVGAFTASDYRVWASVSQGGRGMSTSMFFESVPDAFVDAAPADWHWEPGAPTVPIIISKDYLALYNFGFASSAGLPQMSESIMGSIPLRLELRSEDGHRAGSYAGRIAGYSSRLNTILVPESFMEEANRLYGGTAVKAPSRVMVDVSSPGDVAIEPYLQEHGLEVAGDKSGSSAAYFLRVVTGIVLAIGVLITALSFFILLLSVSLIMEKNRGKIHSLLMLGYPLGSVGRPYRRLSVLTVAGSYVLAVGAVFALRGWYLGRLEGLGAEAGGWWEFVLAGAVLCGLALGFNLWAVSMKIKVAWGTH